MDKSFATEAAAAAAALREESDPLSPREHDVLSARVAQSGFQGRQVFVDVARGA